jgi:hypothetical protein
VSSLTFLVGSPVDVFPGALAQAVGAVMRQQFPSVAYDGHDPYQSEPVEAIGWRQLQERVMRTLDGAPQLTTIDAYQAVYVPVAKDGVEHLAVGNLADPLQVGSLPALLEELRLFAAGASLPTDDLELMQLGLRYLEKDFDKDLDVQTYIQLLLSAKQAVVRNEPLWIVI